MSFRPDIIVTERDSSQVALVVEVQRGARDVESAENQLKHYMFGMRCPVGLVLTPETLRLYVDTYNSYGVSSIENVGEFSIAGILDPELSGPAPDKPDAAHEFRLQAEVQAWLERLAEGGELSNLTADLREALEEHVLPALAQGEVRAAGPRWVHAEGRAPTSF